MSSRSIFACLAAAMLLTGCGFEPIAAPTSTTTETAQVRLAAIDVRIARSGENGRFEYVLRQELKRSLAIDSTSDDRLAMSIAIDREGLAIQQNDTVTRFNLTATMDYSLADANGAELLGGKTVSITALNATASQFSTSVAERDAMRRLAADLAARIVTLLRLHYSTVALAE